MSQLVRVRCAHCSTRHTVDVGFIGSTCRCSRCGGFALVGGAAIALPRQRSRPETPIDPIRPWWAGVFWRRPKPGTRLRSA